MSFNIYAIYDFVRLFNIYCKTLIVQKFSGAVLSVSRILIVQEIFSKSMVDWLIVRWDRTGYVSSAGEGMYIPWKIFAQHTYTRQSRGSVWMSIRRGGLGALALWRDRQFSQTYQSKPSGPNFRRSYLLSLEVSTNRPPRLRFDSLLTFHSECRLHQRRISQWLWQ